MAPCGMAQGALAVLATSLIDFFFTMLFTLQPGLVFATVINERFVKCTSIELGPVHFTTIT